jgi:hypothetical protein
MAKLDDLIEECLNSELPHELQSALVRQLQTIRSSLLEFRISGPAGLGAALEQAAGSVIRHGDAIRTELAAHNSIVEKFFDLLGKANDIASGYQLIAPSLLPVSMMMLEYLKQVN